jgi:hypothetical protein
MDMRMYMTLIMQDKLAEGKLVSEAGEAPSDKHPFKRN